MNRKNRRHPTSPFLPIDQIAKNGLRDNRKIAKPEAKAKGYIANRRKYL